MNYPYIKVISDVHEEFARQRDIGNKAYLVLPAKDTDKDTILVIAGDWNSFASKSKYKAGIERLKVMAKQFKYVIFVMGNHDYWNYRLPCAYEWIQEQLADESNIFVLEKDNIVLNGIRFIGATLWADMAKDPLRAWELNRTWSDLKKIRTPQFRRIRSTEIAAYHIGSYRYIESILEREFTGPTVVITHHAPCTLSVREHHVGWLTDHCYMSDQTDMMYHHRIDYWIHGHMHNSSNYTVHDTNVICNPRGYITELNPDFDPDLLLVLKEDRTNAKLSEDSEPQADSSDSGYTWPGTGDADQ